VPLDRFDESAWRVQKLKSVFPLSTKSHVDSAMQPIPCTLVSSWPLAGEGRELRVRERNGRFASSQCVVL